MTDQRTLIRRAAVAALLNKTAAQFRVQATRMQPWRRGDLPAIALFLGKETADESLQAPREYECHVELVIEAAIAADDNVDDAVDAISRQIKQAMNESRRLSGTCSDTTYTDGDPILLDEGERPTLVFQLTYDVKYFDVAVEHPTVDNPEDDPLDDFVTAAVTTNLGNAVVPGNQVNDVIPLETP